MILRSIILSLLFFAISCQNINFIYKDSYNVTNPLHNKSSIKLTGKNVPAVNKYASRYFGNNKKGDYVIHINISEEKTKRSVRDNQAISKLDYELTFKYSLFYNLKMCESYNKSIVSRFSFVPKSSGYNFGSDRSLERSYELAAKENLRDFINSASSTNIKECINEG